jgi:surface polysaccharide O-acyltransferase-like enzyme
LHFSLVTIVKADIGETYELKSKRNEILERLHSQDSFNKNLSQKDLQQTIQDYKVIVELDNHIFSSYQTTVYRTATGEYEQKLGNRIVVNVTLLLSLGLLLALVMIYRQNKLLKKLSHSSYSFSSLVKELIVVSLPLFQKTSQVYRVNKLLYVGLLVMAVFVFLGLLSQL